MTWTELDNDARHQVRVVYHGTGLAWSCTCLRTSNYGPRFDPMEKITTAEEALKFWRLYHEVNGLLEAASV